jgi:hypothetical protein
LAQLLFFNQVGDEYIISLTNLTNIISELTTFNYDTTGLTETRYLVQYYRVSRNGNTWVNG